MIDNGDGVSADNHETIGLSLSTPLFQSSYPAALKHYTSKLREYSDLESVSTFGFRGEALSSLCALSVLQITTATAEDAPKGVRLEFEVSGKLKSKSVVAASKGTTVSVGTLFKTLPVRRRELERNIKREYAKVLGILQAYASICVGVKFSVFNQPAKGCVVCPNVSSCLEKLIAQKESVPQCLLVKGIPLLEKIYPTYLGRRLWWPWFYLICSLK